MLLNNIACLNPSLEKHIKGKKHKMVKSFFSLATLASSQKSSLVKFGKKQERLQVENDKIQ